MSNLTNKGNTIKVLNVLLNLRRYCRKKIEYGYVFRHLSRLD